MIPGDGIGQEVIPVTAALLEEILPGIEISRAEAGWTCFQKYGEAVPQETLEMIQEAGAALFGAVSSPSIAVAGYRSAIVTLRKNLDLFANVRPVRSLSLPISFDVNRQVDLILFRENTEDLYAGRERVADDGLSAIAERHITRRASERIARRAAAVAVNLGRKKLTVVHKANVLPLSDGLFRDAVRETIAQVAPHLIVDEMLADVAAYWMVREPERFDVIVTTNLFGDILSDAAAHWGGGLGLVPSLNWGDNIAVAEPVHGSAPDIAGRGIANPAAAILSAAMLLKFVWQMPAAAERLERAVRHVVRHGPHTPDLGGSASTTAVGEAVGQRYFQEVESEQASGPPR